jgi:hypothetical protein
LTDNPRHGQQLSRFPFLLARQPKNSLSPDIILGQRISRFTKSATFFDSPSNSK